MKRLFNAVCGQCRTFKPGCAVVWFWRTFHPRGDYDDERTLCADCRRQQKGKYRVDARHK